MDKRFLGIHVVPCNGENHRILIPDRGSVVLLNHKGKAGKHARLITDTFTGTPCGCTNFLAEWKRSVESEPYQYQPQSWPLLTGDHVRRARVAVRGPIEKHTREGYREHLEYRVLDQVSKAQQTIRSFLTLQTSHLDEFRFGYKATVTETARVPITRDGKRMKDHIFRIDVNRKEFVQTVVNHCTVVDHRTVVQIVDKSDPCIWVVKAVRIVHETANGPRKNSISYDYRRPEIATAYIARAGVNYPWLSLGWA